jgi:hypothetical protein
MLEVLSKVSLIVLELLRTPGVTVMHGIHRKAQRTLRKAKQATVIL